MLSIIPTCVLEQFTRRSLFAFQIHVQKNLHVSNTYGSFTTAVSDSFLSALEKTKPIAVNLGQFSVFFFFFCLFFFVFFFVAFFRIENGTCILCVLIRIAHTIYHYTVV